MINFHLSLEGLDSFSDDAGIQLLIFIEPKITGYWLLPAFLKN